MYLGPLNIIVTITIIEWRGPVTLTYPNKLDDVNCKQLHPIPTAIRSEVTDRVRNSLIFPPVAYCTVRVFISQLSSTERARMKQDLEPYFAQMAIRTLICG